VLVLKDAAGLSVKEVFEAFETSPRGLTSEEAAKRLSKYGLNMLREKKRASIAYKFLVHLKDLFSVLLLFASLLAVFGSMWQLSLIILAVVLVNTFFSLFQEWRAEKAMETLKSWMPEYTKRPHSSGGRRSGSSRRKADRSL
jgi:Ca2+-transporting ATPase